MAQTLKEKYERKSQEQQNLNEAFDAKAVQAASSIIKRIANSFKGVQGFDNLIKAKNNIIDKVTDVLTEEEGTGIINKLVKVIKKDDDKDKLPIYMAMSFGASINSFFMLLEEFLRARGDAKGIEVELFKLENDLEDKKVTDLVEANKIAAIVKKGLSPGGQFSKYDWASYGGTSYADIAKDLEAATLGQIADIAKKTKAAFANQGQAIKQVGQALAQGPSGGGGKEASGGGGGKADEAQEATQDILEIDFGGLKTLKTLQNKIKQNPERAEKWIVEFREKLVELFKFLLSKRDQPDIGDKKVSEIFAESSLRFRHLSLLLEEAGQISDKLKQALGGFGGYADDLINDIKDMKYSDIITIATKALTDLGENAGAAPSAPKADKPADEKQAGAGKGPAAGSEKKDDASDKSTDQSAAETGKKSKTPSVAKEKLLGLSIFADKKDEITKLLGDEKIADALGKALFVISNHILKGRVQYKDDLSESLRSRYQKLLTEADREKSKVQLSGYIKKLPQELKNILTPIFIGKNAGDLQKVAEEILKSLGGSTSTEAEQAKTAPSTDVKQDEKAAAAKTAAELQSKLPDSPEIAETEEKKILNQIKSAEKEIVDDLKKFVGSIKTLPDSKKFVQDKFNDNTKKEYVDKFSNLLKLLWESDSIDQFVGFISQTQSIIQQIQDANARKILQAFFINVRQEANKALPDKISSTPQASSDEAAKNEPQQKLLSLEIFDDQQKEELKKALGNDPEKSKKLEDILDQIYDFIAGDRVKYNESGIAESLRSRYLRLLREADETKVALSKFIDSIDDESIKGVLKKIFVGKKKDELVGLVNKVAGRLGKAEIKTATDGDKEVSPVTGISRNESSSLAATTEVIKQIESIFKIGIPGALTRINKEAKAGNAESQIDKEVTAMNSLIQGLVTALKELSKFNDAASQSSKLSSEFIKITKAEDANAILDNAIQKLGEKSNLLYKFVKEDVVDKIQQKIKSEADIIEEIKTLNWPEKIFSWLDGKFPKETQEEKPAAEPKKVENTKNEKKPLSPETKRTATPRATEGVPTQEEVTEFYLVKIKELDDIQNLTYLVNRTLADSDSPMVAAAGSGSGSGSGALTHLDKLVNNKKTQLLGDNTSSRQVIVGPETTGSFPIKINWKKFRADLLKVANARLAELQGNTKAETSKGDGGASSSEKITNIEANKEPSKEDGQNNKQEINTTKASLDDQLRNYLKKKKFDDNKFVDELAKLLSISEPEYTKYLQGLSDKLAEKDTKEYEKAQGKFQPLIRKAFEKSQQDKRQTAGFRRVGGSLIQELSNLKQLPPPSKKATGGGKTGQQSAGDKDDKNDVLKQFKAVVSKIPPKGDFINKVKKSGADPQDLQVLVKKLKIDDLNTLIKLLNIQKPNPQQ